MRGMALAFLLVCSLMHAPHARATRLHAELKGSIGNLFPKSKIRLDGSIETSRGNLYIPLIPQTELKTPGKISYAGAFPAGSTPDVVAFSNGWCFLRVVGKGKFKTIALPHDLPEKLRKHILQCHMPADLIVPSDMTVPASLKSLIGDLNISVLNASGGSEPATSDVSAWNVDNAGPQPGVVLAISPATGKVALLDETNLQKLSELTTDGTPCGITSGGGLAYIADQTKNRVLILDPKKKQFMGQIDLAAQCAPKGVAAFPRAKLLYVSESATNNIAVLELPTGRVLLRTRVPAGPGRLTMSPNGNYLLVLNVPAGLLTIITTMNQRVLASIPVGAMPSFMTVSQDSKRAYVSNRGTNSVAVVDLISRKVIHTLKAGAGPTGVALNKENDKLFVANAKDNTIWVFDLKTNEKVEEVKLPLDVDFPGELSLMPDGKRLLVSSEATDAVGVFNTETLKFESQPVIGFTSDEIRWMAIK